MDLANEGKVFWGYDALPTKRNTILKDLQMREKDGTRRVWELASWLQQEEEEALWAQALKGWGWVDLRDLKNDSVLYPEGRASQDTL